MKCDSQHVVCAVETSCTAEGDCNKAINADWIFLYKPPNLNPIALLGHHRKRHKPKKIEDELIAHEK